MDFESGYKGLSLCASVLKFNKVNGKGSIEATEWGVEELIRS